MNCGDIKRLLSDQPDNHADAHVVATLAWADAVERIDILVMEIRHIQSNIAQLLRKPRLLNLLRYEEIFIWGSVGDQGAAGQDGAAHILPDWTELFEQLDNDAKRLPQLSFFFVLPIDGRSKTKGGDGFKDVPLLERFYRERHDLIRDVSKDVAASLYSTGRDERGRWARWGQEHRRNYHLFRALQRMKRNLILAKLQLCWWGAWAYRLIGPKGPVLIENKRLAHFIAVRSAVMVKLGEAVARLGDLQGQFERALDLGPQEIARPLGGRRRHGALTAAYLHNTSHELWTEVQHLLSFLDVAPANPDAIAPVTTHRWNHDSLWSSHVVFDETIDRKNVDENPSPAIDFLVSSYWAPDRPDLQSMLAHDTSAAALRQRLPLADRMQLSAAFGPLADLFRVLNQKIQRFAPTPLPQASDSAKTSAPAFPWRTLDKGQPTRDGTPPDKVDEGQRPAGDFDLSESFRSAKDDLLPALASDLLAASIHGTAYLFALFQVTFGRGFEQLFKLPSGQIDLGIVKDVWDLGHLTDKVALDWYLRIKVICAWLKSVQFDGERSALGATLVRGVERLSDDLLKHIYGLYQGQAQEWPVLWEHLTSQLCHVVEVSDAANRVKQWRSERLSPHAVASSTGPSIHQAHGSPRPMPTELASFLRKTLITQKAEKPGRGLYRTIKENGREGLHIEEAIKRFDHLYLQDPAQASAESKPSSPMGERQADAQKSAPAPAGLHEPHPPAFNGRDQAGPPCEIDHGLNGLRFFRNLHDIAWEAAIMRGADFLDDLNNRHLDAAGQSPGFGPISTMSLDFQPGRESFQVALEFQLFLTKRPADRLFNSLTLVNGILSAFRRDFERDDLKRWFTSDDAGHDRSPDKDGDLEAPGEPSIKARLDHWIEPGSAAAMGDAALVEEFSELGKRELHGRQVLERCAEIAMATSVETLLRLGGAGHVSGEEAEDADDDQLLRRGPGSWRRSDPAASDVLDHIQRTKLDQLASIVDRETLRRADIRPVQHSTPALEPATKTTHDWKAISSLIALHMYLELNSHEHYALNDRGAASEEKRRRTQRMILDALNTRRDPTDFGPDPVVDGSSIGVREIGYLSISEALEQRDTSDQDDDEAGAGSDKPAEVANDQQRRFRQLYDPPQMDVHPFARNRCAQNADLDWPTATYAACLGRFDRILLSDCSPLLTHRLPRFPRADDGIGQDDNAGSSAMLHYHWDVPRLDLDFGGDKSDLETFAAFVQKRELALELTLTAGVSSTDRPVPLALVSVGLTQRYSRLEFVARLLQTLQDRPKIGAYALEGVYRLFKEGDQAFLTDGAYDLTFMLTGPRKGEHEDYFRRLKDVLRLGVTLHGDFMVDRTETHLLAPMIDSVLAADSQQLSIIQEVRLKESSTQQYAYRYLHEKFGEILKKENKKIVKARDKGQLNVPDDLKSDKPDDLLTRLVAIQPTMHIVPGRADVAISYDSQWLKLHWQQLSPRRRKSLSSVLDQLMSLVLKDWYVDRVATTVGVDPETLLTWGTSDPDPDAEPAEEA